LTKITHIIATNADFPNYLDAFDLLINIVRPKWVTDSLAKHKTMNPRQYSPDPTMIFSEIIATCAGLPEGDVEAIRGAMLGAGGGYSAKVTKLVTHIVALDTEHELVQFAKRKNLQCKVVLPHWYVCLTEMPS
jgi:hypothetical protein